MRKRRNFSHIKKGWAVIGGKRNYYRSQFEREHAVKLQLQKEKGDIKDWEHEPKVFYFGGIRRGTTNYTPDFKVTNLDGSHYWVECKGYWDAKSKTKVKRFAKYFPEEKLICINQR